MTSITTYTLDELNYDEKEAIYSLKVEVLEDTDQEFRVDNRIEQQTCGANLVNFNKYDIPYIYFSDNKAPYHVSLQSIVNQYGTNNIDGKDKLTMYIYSDYLGNAIRFPVFNMKDDLVLYFTETKAMNIPCKSEIIVSLANEENLDILDIHNTVRINCNPVSLGPT